jgi:ABC-type ATPase involved in cell division
MRVALLAWVDSAVKRRATVLVSTHDIAAFEGKAARTLRLDAGRLFG